MQAAPIACQSHPTTRVQFTFYHRQSDKSRRRLCNVERGDFNDDRGRGGRELLNYLEIVVCVSLVTRGVSKLARERSGGWRRVSFFASLTVN